MNPGIYAGIPNKEYHSGIGVSNSGLSVIATRSPAHYKTIYLDERKSEPTPAMIFGDQVHCSVLEPELFEKRFITLPPDLSELSKNSKEYKTRFAEFKAANPGSEMIDSETLSIIRAMTSKVRNHPIAGQLLSGGKAELSSYWNDPVTEVLCKCRSDYFFRDSVIIDLKTTENASESEFMRSVANFRYHVQAAYYLDGMSIATGIKLEKFVFIAVEKKPPYEIAIYEIDFGAIEKGRELYRRALDTYAECLKTNNWPGYASEIKMISVPNWAFYQ